MAWFLVFAYVILAAVGLSLQGLTRAPFGPNAMPVAVILVTLVGVWIVTGALIISRHPRHPVGWLLCAGLFSPALDMFSAGYAAYAAYGYAGSLPGVTLIPGVDGDPSGYSVLGLTQDQNNTTLNGMSFGGSNLPRDAQVSSSVVTSPYDGAELGRVPEGGPADVDRAVENERAYVYAVRAVRTAQDTVARSVASDRASATPLDTTPPRPPADLVAVPSQGTVRLVWTASPEPDVARYLVYRGREGGPFERVGSTSPPAMTFTDREVPPGRWRYAVSAQDSSSRANESGRSNCATATSSVAAGTPTRRPGRKRRP